MELVNKTDKTNLTKTRLHESEQNIKQECSKNSDKLNTEKQDEQNVTTE